MDQPLWDILRVATEYADGRVSESEKRTAEEHLSGVPDLYGFYPDWYCDLVACIETDDGDSSWPGDDCRLRGSAVRDSSIGEVACHCYRELFGNPFRPVAFNPTWRTTDVMLLASGIYDERAFDRMPILADALQEAGCDSDALLGHLRDPHAAHVRGCWALDLVLGKGEGGRVSWRDRLR